MAPSMDSNIPMVYIMETQILIIGPVEASGKTPQEIHKGLEEELQKRADLP